jgi:hypothetical protein
MQEYFVWVTTRRIGRDMLANFEGAWRPDGTAPDTVDSLPVRMRPAQGVPVEFRNDVVAVARKPFGSVTDCTYWPP